MFLNVFNYICAFVLPTAFIVEISDLYNRTKAVMGYFR